MDIHDIKPPGNNGSVTDPIGESPVDQKRESSFAERTSKLQAPESSESKPPALAVTTQFKRAELNDPAKLDSAVRASVAELIDAGQNVTGPLSSAQKQSLVDFLSGDPLVRRQIETYLQKVLS